MRNPRLILCTLALLLAVALSPGLAAASPAQPTALPAVSAACPAPPMVTAGTGSAAAVAIPTWTPAPQPVVACTQICCTSSSQCRAACGQPASCAGKGSCKHCLIF